MKKAIIIMTMIMSILLFDKVEASELSGTYSNVVWWSSPFYTDSNKQNACSTISSNTQFRCEKTLTFGTNSFVELFTDIQLNGNYDYLMIPFAISTSSHSILGAQWQNVMNTIESLQIQVNINDVGSYRTPIYFDVNYNNTTIPTDETSTNEVALVNGYLYIPTHIVNGNNNLKSIYFSFASAFQGSIPFNLVFSNSAMYIKDTNGNVSNAINNQTQQQQQNYNDFKEQNATYTDEINTDMNGANETIQYSQNEEQLLDSLDMNTSILDNININASASAFIWDIVEGVRGMNPAIITLMTSILGLGIAKMILNR